jgi:hypothetical protein
LHGSQAEYRIAHLFFYLRVIEVWSIEARKGLRQAKSFINVRTVSIDGADQERTWKVRVSSEKTHFTLQLRLSKLRASKINYTCMSAKKKKPLSWHIEEED